MAEQVANPNQPNFFIQVSNGRRRGDIPTVQTNLQATNPDGTEMTQADALNQLSAMMNNVKVTRNGRGVTVTAGGPTNSGGHTAQLPGITAGNQGVAFGGNTGPGFNNMQTTPIMQPVQHDIPKSEKRKNKQHSAWCSIL